MARRDITMTRDEMAAFLALPHKLQVATIGPAGRPHLATMWYVLDDEGRIVFRSFTKSQKIVNLRRDPRLTVLAEDGWDYGELRGVSIEGHAVLSEDPDRVLDLYVAIARIHPVGNMDADTARSAFAPYAAKNTVVTVMAEKVVSWDHRKLGGGY